MRQLPLPGPTKANCQCGYEVCGGQFGTLRHKLMRDGKRHINRCPCPRCMTPRHKARARRRESKVAKDAGGRRNPGSGAFGGSDSIEAICEIEETTAKAHVAGLRRWWESKGVQRKVARILGQMQRPPAFVASWDSKPRLVVLPYEGFRQLCALALSERSNDELKGYIHRVRAELDRLEMRL